MTYITKSKVSLYFAVVSANYVLVFLDTLYVQRLLLYDK